MPEPAIEFSCGTELSRVCCSSLDSEFSDVVESGRDLVGGGKKNVLLIHEEVVLHYRIKVYNYLAAFMGRCGYRLSVISDGIQDDCPHRVEYPHECEKLTFRSIARRLIRDRPDAVIFFVGLRHRYLFPVLFLAKVLGVRTIHWGHGSNLENGDAWLKNLAYRFEHWLHDGVIVYAPSNLDRLTLSTRQKAFVANNSLVFPSDQISEGDVHKVAHDSELVLKRTSFLSDALSRGSA